EDAVYRGVVAHAHALELAMARAGMQVAADRAVRADRRADLEIPDAAAVAERLVGEHAGRAELDEVPGERAFERALLEASEVDTVAASALGEVAPARVVAIEPRAAIAG